jgi:hypothetical protein
MPRFVYTVWFRDTTLPPEDQDHEWPACLVIDATTTALALAWGDHLAKDFARRRTDEEFLSSSIVPEDSVNSGQLPVISYGQPASDDEIGW